MYDDPANDMPESGPAARMHEPLCPICRTPAPTRASTSATVVACTSCGLGITVPAPTRDISSDQVFTGPYGGRRLSRRSQWTKEANVRLDLIGGHLSAGMGVLDIGCATGEFVAAARRRGLDARGIDSSRWAVEQARAAGIEEVSEAVADDLLPACSARFDLVGAFHVLEHVWEPEAFLSTCSALLRPGGLLVLEVPNFAAAMANRHPVRWVGPNMNDHVFHYTPSTLNTLVTRSGFHVETIDERSLREFDTAPVWLARRLLWLGRGVRISRDRLWMVARRSG